MIAPVAIAMCVGTLTSQIAPYRMFQFLLVVHIIVGAAMVGVILMQRSEGGGLAGGNSPSGLMSARGAGDFLTRTTAILAGVFVLLSIGLAALATVNRAPAELDDSLVKTPSTIPTTPLPGPASGAVPLAGQAAPATQAPPPLVPVPAPLRNTTPPVVERELRPGENVPTAPRRREVVPDAPPERSERAATPPPAAPAVVPTAPATPPAGDSPQ